MTPPTTTASGPPTRRPGQSMMGDAVLGLVVTTDLAHQPPRVIIRNASDPQIDGTLTLHQQAAIAARIYEKYGYWTTVNSAIATWASITDLRYRERHRAWRLQRIERQSYHVRSIRSAPHLTSVETSSPLNQRPSQRSELSPEARQSRSADSLQPGLPGMSSTHDQQVPEQPRFGSTAIGWPGHDVVQNYWPFVENRERAFVLTASRPGRRSRRSTTRVSRSPPADLAVRDRAGEPGPLAAADVLGLGLRRGLGALRRAAHGRARIPKRRPGGVSRDARHADDVRRQRGPGHRGASGAGDPQGTSWREGERWNAGTHSSWDEKRLRFELHRYLGWPGQVPSYKLGERVWLQAREETKARAGDALSLKDFHSKAPSLGTMGLDPLREALSRC
jgi:Bacterial protein of unknown function (DUF885)